MILFFLKAEVICVTGSIMSCNFLKLFFAIEFSLSKVDEDVLGRRMFAFLCSPQQVPVSPENTSDHCALTLLIPSQERLLLWAHCNGAVQSGCLARKRVAWTRPSPSHKNATTFRTMDLHQVKQLLNQSIPLNTSNVFMD